MNRFVLQVAMLGLMAPLMAHAEAPSVCTSMCTSEKQQCTARAARLTELDDKPSVAEKNPFARTSDLAQVSSESARVTDRLAAQRRNRERTDACNATYKRCSSTCAAPVPPAAEQAAPAQ